MAKQRVEVEVDVPDGWRLTGEYRHVKPTDYYMPESGSVAQWLGDYPSDFAYLIVAPVNVALKPAEGGGA